MKISERIALLKAGYSKDEINKMIDDDLNDNSTVEEGTNEKGTVPNEYVEVLKVLADEVKNLKSTVQASNRNDVEIKQAKGTDDEIVKILGGLINPDINKEEKE